MEETTEVVFVPRYPWDEWFDGQVRRAVQGQDFNVSATNFRSTIRNAAKRHGYTLRTKVDGTSVYFQATRTAEDQ